MSVRLYADLTRSTQQRQMQAQEIDSLHSRIIDDLSMVVAAAKSLENLVILCDLDIHTLTCSIITLNMENSPNVCALGFHVLCCLCRYGISSMTQSVENTKLIANTSVCKLCIEVMSKHPNSRCLFLNGLNFFTCLLISTEILQILSECGIENLIAKCLHLYVLECDIVEVCANMIAKAVAFDADINVQFGRRDCCELLVLALRKNDDHERMCTSICDAMLSLHISDENRAKFRAAEAGKYLSIMSAKRDERSFELLEKCKKLLATL